MALNQILQNARKVLFRWGLLTNHVMVVEKQLYVKEIGIDKKLHGIEIDGKYLRSVIVIVYGKHIMKVSIANL